VAAFIVTAMPSTASAAPLPAASIVLSRSAWGADDTLLFEKTKSSVDVQADRDNGTTSATPQNRVDDCTLAQRNHPSEFKASAPTMQDTSGNRYRWPITYSDRVRLLVVHHTALKVEGDNRSGVERVRALYKYHAESRGWGDVGYHYLIDEEGTIYEGRRGGKGVVGGHAYCNNIGTIGVALLGNFDLETPTQRQTAALQKLLILLADEYGLDLTKPTTFHGKTFTSPVVGHDDLVSTGCPGHYLDEAFGQILRNIQTRNPDGLVKYRVIAKKPTTIIRSVSRGLAPGIAFPGRTSITVNPGGMQRLSLTYTAPEGGAYEGKIVADVRLGSSTLGLFLTHGDSNTKISSGIPLPSDVPSGETITIQLLFIAPHQQGSYWMEIGGQKFMITVAGRRSRTTIDTSRFGASLQTITQPTEPAPEPARTVSRRSIVRRTPSRVTSASSSDRPIRIKLSLTSDPAVHSRDGAIVNGTSVPALRGAVLAIVNGKIRARDRVSDVTYAEGDVLRFSPIAGPLAVESVRGIVRAYRGVIEARIINGSIVLINELPLETYLRGLAEEPDSEPYEKQRAFAIAARTYAAWYMDPLNRKFPGMPYDGSDDPAVFQSYAGANFESANPSWIRAAISTSGQVLTFDGKIIKPPYFSSDDGRTRSPEEIGWKNFPFSEIFQSRSDPWCRGFPNRGHGVGMSGCGAEAQANLGKSAEEILQYYYPGTVLTAR